MPPQKWLITFVCTIVLLLGTVAAFNALVDPFGVFGDPIFDWYSYNTTQNPRVAKVAYIGRNHERFDSFIIGPSGTSAYPVEMLDEHFGASFFNMFMYGADLLDVEQTVRYLIDNYTVQNLVVGIYIDNAIYFDTQSCRMTMNMHVNAVGGSRISFFGRYLIMNPQYSIAKINAWQNRTYLPQAFNVFDMTTGAYDKRARTAEPIGCLESYLDAYPIFANYPPGRRVMWETDRAIESITRIRDMANMAEVNLLVLFSPVYFEHFHRFYESEVVDFFTRLADIVPFWDFSMSSVSFEPRFFYDETHFRTPVGAMALARVFGIEGLFVPDDFGVFVTSDNAEAHAARLFQITPADPVLYTANVPILMYHHITDDVRSDMDVTPETFYLHMRALYENGFTPVTLQQLVDFVDQGAPLPPRPVAITFDDGYLSVYEHAFPVLRDFGLTATTFVIGSAVGTSYYGDTHHPTIPKFCFLQALAMYPVMSIQSHTYDMHQRAPFEVGRARENILMWDDEDELEYIAILRNDHRRMVDAIQRGTGEHVFAVAFPHGIYDTLSQAVLQSLGIRVTLSTAPGCNTIIKGLPQSLLSLNRFTVPDHMDTNTLLSIVGTSRG